MARRKKKGKINPSDLSPLIASGLTQGLSKKEALEAHPRRTTDGRQVITHMRDADQRLDRGHGNRFAQYVAEDDLGAVWTDGQTDRLQRDVVKTYTPEGMRALKEGRQCLRCDEPHFENPFPIVCDFPDCGYPMRERQIMDIAMEFEGNKHLGPAHPISGYMEDLELRTEKRKFIDKQVEKGSLERIPKDWLRDAVLFPNGPPTQLG